MDEENKLSLKQEIERYQKEILDIPDPSCGRIGELKEKIENGELLTREAVQEAAERIAARFLGKD